MNAAKNRGYTALIQASYFGRVEVARLLLVAGANKHHIANNGTTAYGSASHTPASTAAIRALLDLAP